MCNELQTEYLTTEYLFKKKMWDERIMDKGGVSYYKPVSIHTEKEIYRVAMTYKRQHTKKLKWKITTASGEIFSVAAKRQSDAQTVVNELFGNNKYKVSSMLEV